MACLQCRRRAVRQLQWKLIEGKEEKRPVKARKAKERTKVDQRESPRAKEKTKEASRKAARVAKERELFPRAKAKVERLLTNLAMYVAKWVTLQKTAGMDCAVWQLRQVWLQVQRHQTGRI